MKLLKFLSLALLLSFALVSCSDDSGLELSLTSPSDGSTFAPGDTIVFSGMATDDLGVTSISVTNTALGINGIVDGASNATVTFSFDLATDSATPVGEYEMLFLATDTDGNTEEEKLKVNIAE